MPPDETTSAGTPDPALVEPVIVEQPAVAEIQAAPESESPVSASAESVVEASMPAVTEPTQTPEQPAETAQPSVSAPVGDLALTPQLPVNEALTPENTSEKQPLEQPSVPAVLAPEPAPEPVKTGIPLKNIARELLVKARNSIQLRKRKKLDRIMGLFAKQASITNDDADELANSRPGHNFCISPYLSISEEISAKRICAFPGAPLSENTNSATASRYLGILEKEGKVKQVGRAGRWVSYTKV